MIIRLRFFIKVLMFIGLVSSHLMTYGQNSTKVDIDSLLIHIKQNETEGERKKQYEALLAQAEYLDEASLNKVRLHFGNYYLKLGHYTEASKLYQTLINSLTFQEETAHAYNNLGISLKKQGNYKESLPLLTEAWKSYETWGHPKQQARVLINVAQVHRHLGNFNKEIEALFKSRPLIDSLLTVEIQATLYYSLSRAHNTIKEHQKAIEFQHTAIQLRKQLDDRKGLSASYNELANSYREQKRFDQAIVLYKQAIQIKDSLGLSSSLAVSYHNLGSTYYAKEHIDSALYFYERSYLIRDSLGDSKGLAMTAKELALMHLTVENYDTVLHYLAETEQWADSVDALNMQLRIADVKQQYFEAISEQDSALYYSKVYNTLYETYYAQENAKALLALQEKYESQRKDKQILDLTETEKQLQREKDIKDLKIRQFNLIVLLLSIVILFLIILFFFYKNRLQLQHAIVRQDVQEQIKNKMAIALHDGVANKLSGIRLKMLSLTIPKEHQEDFYAISDELSALYEYSRDLSHQLVPIAYHLEKQTLTQVLRNLFVDFERYRKIRTDVIGLNIKELNQLKKQSKIALYSILEESLLNVYKHSKANAVQISISQNRKHFTFVIQDFGIGISNQYVGGIGLNNIKSHTNFLKGVFQIQNTDLGCAAQLIIPKKHN